MSDKLPPGGDQAPNDGTLAPHTPAQPTPTGPGGNYPSADTVKGKLEAQSYPREHIDSILWLLEYGRSLKASQSRLGDALDMDGSVISRLFSGNYPGDVQKMIDKIDFHRRVLAQEMMGKDRPICETWVLTEIDKTCHLVRHAETMGILTGRSHTGKTTALQVHKQRNNHGLTIYVQMPPGGAPRMFLIALARACGISARNAYDQLRDRLIRFFKPGMLLIVDQAHEAIIGRKLQIITLELIRDLHDVSGAGVLLCGTPVLDESFRDSKLSLYFEQIDNRAPIKRRLPDVSPWPDVELILNAYGLPPASKEKLLPDDHRAPLEIVHAMVGKNGLGKLCKFLVIAREAAKKKREVFAWKHVVGLDAMLVGWARGDGPKTLKGGR